VDIPLLSRDAYFKLGLQDTGANLRNIAAYRPSAYMRLVGTQMKEGHSVFERLVPKCEYRVGVSNLCTSPSVHNILNLTSHKSLFQFLTIETNILSET
jgi:hypothetical protein